MLGYKIADKISFNNKRSSNHLHVFWSSSSFKDRASADMNLSAVDGKFMIKCLIGNNEQWFSQIVGFPSREFYVNHVILCVLNLLLTFSSTFLNFITVFAYWRSTRLQKKMSYFLVMLLSLSDLGVGLICNSIFTVILTSHTLGYSNCLLSTFWLVAIWIFPSMSLTTLFVLNFERYLGIIHPIFHVSKVTKRGLLTATATLWFLIVVEVCALFFEEKILRVLVSLKICSFLVALISFYVKIFVTGRGAAMRGTSEHADRSRQKAVFVKKTKLAKSCLIVVSCNMFCFLPSAVTSFAWKRSFFGLVLFSWGTTFVLMASTLNSVIFFWRNQILRSEAKTILRETFLCCLVE